MTIETITGSGLASQAPDQGKKRRESLLPVWSARPTLYLAALGLWFALAEIRPRVPGPWAVVRFIYLELTGGSHGGVLKGTWLPHVTVTLERFAIGLVISILLGVAVGVLIGSWRYFHALLNDTLLVFLALPAVIWAFITVIWFGLGTAAPVWTTVLTAFPFVAVNVTHGVQAVTNDLHLMSDAFGIKFTKRLRHLILPAITGYFFAGVRFAVIVGWNGILLAEWFGSADGVGWRMRYWYDAVRYQGFVGWILLVVIFIVVVDQLVLAPLEKRAFRWRDIHRQVVKAEDQQEAVA
jgi:ABC-type nitrate/sulfonate/bicarbonate transport system permease component